MLYNQAIFSHNDIDTCIKIVTSTLKSMNPEKLAIDGGNKINPPGAPTRKLFGVEEKEAVMRLFDEAIEKGSDVLGYNGVQEEAYCREFAEFMGGGFADGVNSGTNAVFVALRALELEPYSEVILSPITDPGGMMPVALCNLIPVPADTGTDYYNTTAEQIAKRITDRTRAILITHIAGRPMDMEPVMELAQKHNLLVIEDCAQSHGTVINTRGGQARKAGSFGHIATFSTMFGKHHASGGQGGMIFTTKEDFYWRVRRHADRGKPFGITVGGGAGAGVGRASVAGANAVAALNCNMDEIHAAIGRVQLRKLPGMVAHRRRIALKIAEGCKNLAGVSLVADPAWGESSFWFLFFRFDSSAYRVDKKEFVIALSEEGFPCSTSYGHFPARMIWADQQQVFGTSGLPWSAVPGTKKSGEYPTPNAEAVDAVHFLLYANEAWSDGEADLTIKGLAKVDAAFRI